MQAVYGMRTVFPVATPTLGNPCGPHSDKRRKFILLKLQGGALSAWDKFRPAFTTKLTNENTDEKTDSISIGSDAFLHPAGFAGAVHS